MLDNKFLLKKMDCNNTRDFLEKGIASSSDRKREIARLGKYRIFYISLAGFMAVLLLCSVASNIYGATQVVILFGLFVKLWISSRLESKRDLLILIDLIAADKKTEQTPV